MIAPEILIYIALPIIMFIAFEVGYQVGRWRAKGKPEEKEGPTGMLVGSMLALMAFLHRDRHGHDHRSLRRPPRAGG